MVTNIYYLNYNIIMYYIINIKNIIVNCIVVVYIPSAETHVNVYTAHNEAFPFCAATKVLIVILQHRFSLKQRNAYIY